MKQNFQYTLILALSIGLMVTLFKCDKPAYKGNNEIDTLTYYSEIARFDSINDLAARKELFWSDSITKLNERLKTPLIKWKYIYSTISKKETVVKDSLTTGKENLQVDNDCCFQIQFANELIMSQDSLTQIYGLALSECLNHKVELSHQAETFKIMADVAVKENNSYKHIVWRLYWKK